MAKFETVDDYIASFPEDVQETLQAVRRTIREAAPGTEETIRLRIPTFTWKGRYVVYFAGWKHHVSVYPIPSGDEALEKDSRAVRGCQGTLRFPLDTHPSRIRSSPGWPHPSSNGGGPERRSTAPLAAGELADVVDQHEQCEAQDRQQDRLDTEFQEQDCAGDHGQDHGRRRVSWVSRRRNADSRTT